MSRESEEAIQTAYQFVKLVTNKDWIGVSQLLGEEFEGYWPLSNEVIDNTDNFTEALRRYPAKDSIQIQNSHCKYDQWEMDYTVIIQASIMSIWLDGKETRSHAIWFFAIDSDCLITSFVEYRSVNQEPADWRKGLSRTEPVTQ